MRSALIAETCSTLSQNFLLCYALQREQVSKGEIDEYMVSFHDRNLHLSIARKMPKILLEKPFDVFERQVSN